MKISLSALGLAGLAWLFIRSDVPALHFAAFCIFGAAVIVGLWGAINAAVDRSMHREDRIAAVVLGAFPAALAVFGIVAVYFAAQSGAFD